MLPECKGILGSTRRQVNVATRPVAVSSAAVDSPVRRDPLRPLPNDDATAA